MAVNNSEGHASIGFVETKKSFFSSSDEAPKQILRTMELDFPDNAITAILGPSGSGKTTLLNLLTDSMPSNVLARASVGFHHVRSKKRVNAYVPQEDRLHGFFTCKKYLEHYARLSYDGSSPAIGPDRITEMLSSLGLSEKADTIVGDIFLQGLSGGQKRRLSMALEALTNPNNFFLDEPTSGLDAESALQIMEFLKTYVRSAPNRRVVLTIHQPSSFIWTLIDHVVLLSKGKLMYQGPRAEMEDFFSLSGCPTPEGWNPADHYVTVVNDEFRDHQLSVDEWAGKFKEWKERQTQVANVNHNSSANGNNNENDSVDDSMMPENVNDDGNNENDQDIAGRTKSIWRAGAALTVDPSRSTSSLRIVMELSYRYFLNLWFNPGILGVRIAMYSMLAGMVGALFWDLGSRTDHESIHSRTAVLFYCVSFFVFMSVAVLPFTVMERGIVDKEVKNRYYHPVLYQVSQAISTIPAAALLALLTTGIVIPMTGLNDVYWYYLTMFLSLVVAEALAQLVSHVVPHFVIGMAVIAGLYGFFMLFQGFMLIPSDFPAWLTWTNKIAFHTYAWRTFMVSEFRNHEEGVSMDGLERNPDEEFLNKFFGNYNSEDSSEMENVYRFDSIQFQTGEQVLQAFEIEDVNRVNDMIVLVFYAIILHVMSFAVLQCRYFVFNGEIEPMRIKKRGSIGETMVK